MSTPTHTHALGIEAVGISKRFGRFTALDNVTIKVKPGAFHALLGENGAGKSTLVKCLIGYYRPDSGGVLVGEREHDIPNPRAAHALGIGMVYQHFTLVPGMTVAENLVMARADVPFKIDWKTERARLAAFFKTVPFQIPLDKPVASLAAGEKQKVEILKQLYLDRRFLILDEPTSVLTPGEADEVLGLLRNLTAAQRLTILMISHKFREVMAFADEVTVLRRGQLAGHGLVQDLTPAAMAEMMIGAKTLPETASRSGETGDVRLAADNLCANGDNGLPAVTSVNLQIRAGEIFGIAGVSGNGQRELVETLTGQRLPSAGTIRVHDEPYHATRNEMRRHRVFSLPEEPLRNACVPKMSVADNLALRSFDQPPYAVRGWLRHKALRQRARELIAEYRVKTSSPAAPIATLSGGNVQRAVLARELTTDVAVLIVANPVFGLDFAAVAEIHGRIMQARNRGAAVLLVSEDLDEILKLADRIAVMSGGRLVYETTRAAADVAIIGRHMAGHGEHEHDDHSRRTAVSVSAAS